MTSNPESLPEASSPVVINQRASTYEFLKDNSVHNNGAYAFSPFTQFINPVVFQYLQGIVSKTSYGRLLKSRIQNGIVFYVTYPHPHGHFSPRLVIPIAV
jgi:hypothetical protein